ncbi:hypothetical protein DMB66_56160 [Actinoplanes sp. ATCC 53533]|nr:hypothetical protein DMB66_56160 [Actinoplanes sp. ATCC 53533]
MPYGNGEDNTVHLTG